MKPVEKLMWINEIIAKKGDWETIIDKLEDNNSYKFGTDLSKFESEFKLLTKINELNLYYREYGKHISFRLGTVKDNKFYLRGLLVANKLNNFMTYSEIIRVESVVLAKSYRGGGYAFKLYEYIVSKLNLTILGDIEQYFGARKLYSNLSQRSDLVKVDIIDYDKKKLLDSGSIIHQGENDYDFDERVWSYNNDKENIRLILRKA